MSSTYTGKVLSEQLWHAEGSALWAKRILLVVAGIITLAVSAKIGVNIWPSPVPITMGTFAVLTIGAAYGPRLALTTIFSYMLIGMLGFDVFAKSSAEANGLEYMMGSTGGYLVGFVLATVLLGYFARLGWDRSIVKTALAMVLGNVVIYVFGILWLGHLYTWEQPIITWGLTPFIVGDAIKIALAALLLPGLWKLVGKARG